jgi:hypothetical protein
MNTADLTTFLHRASMPHAFGNPNATSMPDGSTTITFAQGDWTFHDNFFGGQPYGGRAVIHYQQKPVWVMVYYGQIHDTSLAPGAIYDFLRLALQHAPAKKPYRGPDNFAKGDLEYRNSVEGSMSNYSGREIILQNGAEIFWTTYLGGLVDQDAGAGF